ATLQFTRARAMRRRLWPMLAAAAVFIVVGAIVVVQMNPAMAPTMLSKNLGDYAAESVPQAAMEKSDAAASQQLHLHAPLPAVADEAVPQSAPVVESEMDTESVQGPGAVSSGPANGYFQGQSLSAEKGGRPAAPMTQPEPMIAGMEAGRVEAAPPPQRQDEQARRVAQQQGRMEAGESAATDAGESEPQHFGDNAAGAMAPPAEAPAPTAMRGRDADDSGVKSLAEEGLAREKPMVAEESLVVDTRTVAERMFQRRGEDWIQEDYNDESLTTVRRESEAWNVLVRKEFDLAAVLELEGRVVFKQGDIWYELLPAEPATR
ncbi:MAG: hypothetical protein KJ060_09665, partial [Candidatus Hydrogenedentes bacterium]|nr:hypothetical protein [Candidatus Hydrogenedentota bacterium]